MKRIERIEKIEKSLSDWGALNNLHPYWIKDILLKRVVIVGSGLEILLFAYRCLRYHLTDGSIMNSQIVRNLFQSVSMTHVSSMDAYISLCLRLNILSRLGLLTYLCGRGISFTCFSSSKRFLNLSTNSSPPSST
jgi:hypothetical protein